MSEDLKLNRIRLAIYWTRVVLLGGVSLLALLGLPTEAFLLGLFPFTMSDFMPARFLTASDRALQLSMAAFLGVSSIRIFTILPRTAGFEKGVAVLMGALCLLSALLLAIKLIGKLRKL